MTNLYSKLQQIGKEFEGEFSGLIQPDLDKILNQFQHLQDDETQLKIALRQFLSDRDEQNNSNSDYRFRFATEPLDIICIRIAEEIAEENEPIISLIKKSLATTIQYRDESFLPRTLQQLTEYRDGNNKRRLKDLSHFGLSDDRTVLISYLRSCEVAVIMEQDVFCDQTEVGKPLSASEQARLLKWQNGLGKECVDYCSSEGLWVMDHFLNHTVQENTFLYELNLLQECLLNAGITRTNERNHDLDSGKIAEIGIKRFYNVWLSLKETERSFLMSLMFNHFHFFLALGPVLYRIFSGVKGLPNLDPEIIEIAQIEPYIEFSCVEVQAEIIEVAKSKYASAMQQVTVPLQPPIKTLKEVIDRREALIAKLVIVRAKIDRPYYSTFPDFMEGLRNVSKKNRLTFCEAVGWDKINDLIKTKQKSDLMRFLQELIHEFPNVDAFKVFEKIDRNLFSIFTYNDLHTVADILHGCEVVGTTSEFKHLIPFPSFRASAMQPDILEMRRRLFYQLGIDVLISVINNEQAICCRGDLFASMVAIHNDAIKIIYTTKNLFERIHLLDLTSDYCLLVNQHFYLLVKYQNEWRAKFNIPTFNNDSDVLAYIIRIFQEIEGFSKYLFGFWGKRGNDYARRIIEQCHKKDITLPQMMEYLITELQNLINPIVTSTDASSKGPRPTGGTAMRILHCLHVVACQIHGLEQNPKKDLPPPAAGTASVSTPTLN